MSLESLEGWNGEWGFLRKNIFLLKIKFSQSSLLNHQQILHLNLLGKIKSIMKNVYLLAVAFSYPIVSGNMPVVLPLQNSIDFFRQIQVCERSNPDVRKVASKREEMKAHHKGDVDDINGKDQHAIFGKMHPRHWVWVGPIGDCDEKAEF